MRKYTIGARIVYFPIRGYPPRRTHHCPKQKPAVHLQRALPDCRRPRANHSSVSDDTISARFSLTWVSASAMSMACEAAISPERIRIPSS
jgi:hypothetical protein